MCLLFPQGMVCDHLPCTFYYTKLMDTEIKIKDNRGGSGRGQGRKLKDPTQGKRIKCAITMTPEMFAKTSGNRSDVINMALELYYSTII
jgi:hypothetical protein